ncbi:MAG TPA: 2-C-methyl-D-erythritol 2,4-cyclodiphosphate synthase [Leptospiraceae bacterium]|nr:2-C-methyl-D-erythritol 2,4-cyclodiphosphate synthase [Leptospiraceae bacterium]HMW06619.1 2-C-methyl-D-erythritol 2,4-cyclodiphosphate synthase [Leptospiraceae bacterium]HMX32047.1 2-C-methyl-D-erythritol 2,4-cyclodiphosphate synthase [Leptospiraceae bacterium]HMY31190.1 2-C-methyl-D-erythritol 2,4-cyclodiphosphate synthase [Leptospiraceae bacterium]HMZ63323.1 2-C-methyl-D-erythritol 2,4-cyclodiphosphate synthase [Leptospiraceae bacterium]
MPPKYRTGNGIDFHQLAVNPDRPLILGGYTIESEWSLIGHSDADIVLHALSDAILGALGLGDIGQYFPDTDKSLKNMDSSIILKKCLELMRERGYKLLNVDNTIIGEKPKIAPHRINIISSLAKLLEIPVDQVSVKATTTEKMGALGRSEGLAVFSTVMLELI